MCERARRRRCPDRAAPGRLRRSLLRLRVRVGEVVRIDGDGRDDARGGAGVVAGLPGGPPFASPHQGSPHVRARLLHPPRGGGDDASSSLWMRFWTSLLSCFQFSRPRMRSGASPKARLRETSGIRLVFSRSCTEMAGRLSVIALTRDRPNGGGRPRSPRTESGGGGILGTDSNPPRFCATNGKTHAGGAAAPPAPPPQEGGRMRNGGSPGRPPGKPERPRRSP